MANIGPNTNGSQFFIVQAEKGALFLDGNYSIFGQVFEGIEAVDQIAATPTGPNDRPIMDVKIERVEIMEYEPKSN